MSSLWSCVSRPGTFSSSRYAGRRASASRAISKKRVPLASANPFLLPALENAWQGNPPHKGRTGAGRWGRLFLRLDSIVPPLGCHGWRGSWLRRTCRSHSGQHTGNRPRGSVRPGNRRSPRTYQNSGSGHIISLLQRKQKAEDAVINIPGLRLWFGFSIEMSHRSSLPNQSADAAQQDPAPVPCRPSGTLRRSAALREWPAGCSTPPAAGARPGEREVQPPFLSHPVRPLSATSGLRGARSPWRSDIHHPG